MTTIHEDVIKKPDITSLSDHDLAVYAGKKAENLNVSKSFDTCCLADMALCLDRELKLHPDDRSMIFNAMKDIHSLFLPADERNQVLSSLRKKITELFVLHTGKESISDAFATVIESSPEYLLTLRRNDGDIPFQTTVYSDEFTHVFENSVQRFMDDFENGIDCYDDDTLMPIFSKYFETYPEIRELIAEDHYAQAFSFILDRSFEDAKDFAEELLKDDDLSFDYECEMENLDTDFDYFGFPVDETYIMLGSCIDWRGSSGAKLFNLDSDDSNYASQLVENVRFVDGDCSAEIKFRTGEPFLTATVWSHDIPTGSSVLLIPESWLPEALKYQDVQKAFQSNPFLREIKETMEYIQHIHESASGSKTMKAFDECLSKEIASYPNFKEFHERHRIEDCIWYAMHSLSSSKIAKKNPEAFFSEIEKHTPIDVFGDDDAYRELKDKFLSDVDKNIAFDHARIAQRVY